MLGVSYEDFMEMGVIQIADVQGTENGLLSDPWKMVVSVDGAHGIGIVR